MVKPLDSCRLQTDVVRSPEDAELVAFRGELADQVGECAVVRVASSFEAEERHGVLGCTVPVV
jgi:hypothetical protein